MVSDSPQVFLVKVVPLVLCYFSNHLTEHSKPFIGTRKYGSRKGKRKYTWNANEFTLEANWKFCVMNKY